MNTLLYTLLFTLAAIILITLVWRFISNRWSLPCPSWLGWMVEIDNPLSNINRAATIIKRLELQPDMVVLDAGCGPGRVTVPLAQKLSPHGTVVALDIQEAMLQKVQEKAHAANLNNIRYIHAGLPEGKLEENRYDRALLVTVIGEIPNKEATFQKLFYALKPGGVLSITEIMLDPHYQKVHLVRALTKKIGFKEKGLYADMVAYNLLIEKPKG